MWIRLVKANTTACIIIGEGHNAAIITVVLVENNVGIIIDDKVVETKVMKQEKAQERYDDAVASGNAAVLAERKKKDDTMTIKLGNLLPGQSATLKVYIVHQLEVVSGYYAFSLPVAFYPDYKRHGVSNTNEFVYEFSYEVKITADG